MPEAPASSPHAPAPVNILLAGFEPFDRDSVNPSWEGARALDGWQPDRAAVHGTGSGEATGETGQAGDRAAGHAVVHALQLRCVFGQATAQLDEAIATLRPALVICLGLAGGRADITPERVAINIDDARIADNAGLQPVDRAVVSGAPAAYFSSLPIKAIVHALRAAGLPASVSNTAGTFVCNHVFFALMHRLAQAGPGVQARGGFIHVPYLPEQAARFPGAPSMALETQIAALQSVIRTSLAVSQDLRETAGRLH